MRSRRSSSSRRHRLLTACLNSTTLVKLKPDGSGTVEQTTLVNMAALKGMGGGAAGPRRR